MSIIINKSISYIKSKSLEIINNKIDFKDLLSINNKNNNKGNNIDINMDNNDEIISKLKFIGKVRQGEKINIRNMVVQQEGLLTKIVRSFITVDNIAHLRQSPSAFSMHPFRSKTAFTPLFNHCHCDAVFIGMQPNSSDIFSWKIG